MRKKDIHSLVRDRYGNIANTGSSCCGPKSSCCGPQTTADVVSKTAGYTGKELATLPNGANLGLGCGNPLAHVKIKEGDIVLDLGSGAGIDCFLAAEKVGPNGRVIGIDMTPEMLEKARKNAQTGGYTNVEFRLGEIEHLPVADSTVDLIISNCVINLSPDKGQVLKEAYRILKPGGQVMISDIVISKPLPEVILNSVSAYAGCVAGAISPDEYLELMKQAGFSDIVVVEKQSAPIYLWSDASTGDSFLRDVTMSQDEVEEIARSICSAKIHAAKPGLSIGAPDKN